MSISQKLNETVIPAVMKFVNLKPVVALKDGILFILPLTLIGSVFLLLAQIPYQPFNDWMASMLSSNWTEPLMQAYGASFKIIALVATMAIAYVYTKNEGHEPFSAGVISLVVFLLTTNSYVTLESGEKVSEVIPKAWTGGEGMVTAIIIGLLVGMIYSWFLRKNITIKMPAGVPQGVANSFAALIPGAVIIVGATIIYTIFKYGLNTTFIEWIYKMIQTPLQGLSDSLGGVIVMCFLIPSLWWFGVHGSTIVGGVMDGILITNATSNQAIIDSGLPLTIENGGLIVTQQFKDCVVNLSGAGATIGLVICMLFLAKSAQSKQLGKLAIVPACFNINEPVIFGTPIVMNPFMAIPFIATPVVIGVLQYLAISMGLIPLYTGVVVPWTTPPIISGFLTGGWRTALFQVVVIAISTAIYFPFFKKVDNMNYENEKSAQN
ncbi:PTS sugar transporter subunit IIC [Clostridium neonatale]|uniref:Permease IIC component n=1 Tax=Clostridium neonatale TaxID=137838 RepID=A0AAD1YLP9_9CLOT|nr:PTS sugar transporter subunit IIC [Clostridium neonatale]CAI3198701.1 PTS system, lactose/cellobiose-family IIC component [Clostridium neonatale]CAI3209213.1 PTS system, lactose/cellobiose-family IIC component [Clostridium neonatale]CAI3212931.1 PTS system, lactose/cellobiose-family IIC component [Clostridium neonatale]CAI3232661.1 PTS system, lactose/cellobiose-family IIC component [Clostridium neonatale]CAI3247765.1 PTS system, lactose/cellobiose-family IIC component [Clostridium neonatal